MRYQVKEDKYASACAESHMDPTFFDTEALTQRSLDVEDIGQFFTSLKILVTNVNGFLQMSDLFFKR